MAAIFADVLESTREPGTSRFSASGVADLLGLQQQDLAELAGVHRNTLRTHPESPRLQSALRALVRVLSAATAVQPDPQRAIFLVKNEPIPAFQHKTLLQLIQEGRTEDAIGYLESTSAGFVGRSCATCAPAPRCSGRIPRRARYGGGTAALVPPLALIARVPARLQPQFAGVTLGA